MAGKPGMVLALEGLPQDLLKEVKEFIDSGNRNGRGWFYGVLMKKIGR